MTTPAADDWSPDKPLPNAEEEEQANARAKAQARVEYLKRSQLSKIKADDKKKFKLWDD